MAEKITQTVVLVNGSAEAKTCLKLFKPGAEQTLFLSFWPDAFVQLRNEGYRCLRSDEFFSNEALGRAAPAAQRITRWLQENAAFSDAGLGIKESYLNAFLFWARFAVNSCLFSIETCLNCVERTQPSSLRAALFNQRNRASLYLEASEGYLGRIAQRAAETNRLPFQGFEAEPGQLSALHTQSLGRFLGAYLRFELWEKLFLARTAAGRRPMLFTTLAYNFERLMRRTQQEDKSIRCDILRGPALPPVGAARLLAALSADYGGSYLQEQTQLFEQLRRRMEENPSIFTYRSVFFGDIIDEKITGMLNDYILRLMAWSRRLDIFVRRSRVALFVSNGNRADDVALAELSRARGIPDLLISHGSHVEPKNETERFEWGEHARMLVNAPYSHIAQQTPVIEGFFKAFPTKARRIKTGPLIWGMESDPKKREETVRRFFGAERPGGNRRVIVHAGTPKAIKSLRLSIYETPDEYLSAIAQLAEAVRALPDTALIIKFRPSPGISAATLNAFLPQTDNILVDSATPFLEVIGIADLLVSFSSTTIEEALQNRVPVLLFGGEGRYQHIPATSAPAEKLGRAAVYHCTNKATLTPALAQILGLRLDGKGKDAALFEPYRYPPQSRQGLKDALS